MNNCYIYFLIDPNTDLIFYVGKGTNYRDRTHIKPSLWKNPKNTCNPFLYYKIQSLMNNNTPPIIKRIHENLDEQCAYELEQKYILEYGRRFAEEKGQLFNISTYKGGSCVGASKTWSEERKEHYKELCKSKRIYDPTYDELYTDYIELGLMRKDIASKNGISVSIVKDRLKAFGIKKPKDQCYPPRNHFICICCGKHFYKPSCIKFQKYCSSECYRRFDNDI